MSVKIDIPMPSLQVEFSQALRIIKNIYLRDALCATLDSIDIETLDKELAEFVPKRKLTSLAKIGMRGEVVFPVPCLLLSNPFLLGYYRLLLGFSQKEFYTKRFGLASYKSMESQGKVNSKNKVEIDVLCKALIKSLCFLIDGIGIKVVNNDFIDDLSLLTLGPQLRGGANVKKGMSGIILVFKTIEKIVLNSIVDSTSSKIMITNAAGRNVIIQFAPDPDIVILEEMSNNNFRNIIAIEVKAGTDFSNIHNRVGEAEKSHQKAKANGFVECWTVVNVDRIDVKMAEKESPSTNRFYKISSLQKELGDEFEDFKNRIISLTGITND